MLTLLRNQQQLFDRIEGSNNCFAILGEPGVGKSVLINALRENGAKHYEICAPTGLAALNIRGKTIHGLFGIKPSEGVYREDYNNFSDNPNVQKHLTYAVKHIVIDEISMVRADMLDFLDRQMQFFKGNNLPFGGVQVIVVGDFFQLPPIVKPWDIVTLRKEGYKSPFAFDARVFRHFEILQLNEVVRQTDKKFIALLRSVRIGKPSLKELKLLNEYVTRDFKDIRVKLCATNAQSEAVNTFELNRLTTEPFTFEAEIFGSWPMGQFPVDSKLILKEGAQVIVKKNYKDKPFVNGSLAKLGKIDEKGANINEYKIEREQFVQRDKRNLDGKWTDYIKGTFTQIPLQLAWAISMHKSQGQTFEKAHISPDNVFADGQLYVALSRLKSLDGLTLHSKIESKHFTTSKRVLEWYKQNNLQ